MKNNILVQWKAVFMMLAAEISLIAAAVINYMTINKIRLPEEFNTLYTLIIIIPLIGIKVYFFERNENWKKYIAEFEKWPEKKRKKWDWIMRCIVFLAFASLIVAFYWRSTIDWKQYR